MSAAKHTPGPWEAAGPVGKGIWIQAKSNANVAAVHGAFTEEGRANAQIIVAAPVMLEALKGIHAALTPMTGGVKIDRASVVRICAEAIALAEGLS